MKKILILIISMILMIGMVSAATTYYVAPGGDDLAVGSEAAPWASIGTHLFGGSVPITSGDTMFIKNGTYIENITALHGIYTTKSFTLIGEDMDGVVIVMADYVSTTTDNYYGFYPDEAVANFYNLTLESNIRDKNYPGNCIRYRDASNGSEIKNVRFKNCYYAIGKSFGSGVVTNLTITDSIFENTIYTIVGDSDGWNDSIFINNTINTTYLYYESGSSIVNVNFSNNEMNLKSLQINELTEDIQDTNTVTYETISFIDFNPVETYTLSNINIPCNLLNTTLTACILFDESSNIVLDNIQFCGNNYCDEETGFSTSLIGSIGGYNYYSKNNNITIKNINVDISKKSNSNNGISIFGNNMSIINNNINIINTTGSGIYTIGDNNRIEGNIVTKNNNTAGYGLGCGKESPVSYVTNNRYESCIIKNNIINASNGDTGTALHTLFLGYTNNSILDGNIVYEGGYGHVIKGNTNSIIKNGKILNNPNNNGMYIKGGFNLSIENYIIDIAGKAAITSNPDDTDTYVDNISYKNISIISDSSYISLSRSGENFFYDVTGQSSFVLSGNSTMDIYDSIAVSGQRGTDFIIIDNESVNYTFNTDSYTTTYFKSGFGNSTIQIDLSSYSYMASQYGQEEFGTFTLDVPYILVLPRFTASKGTCNSITSTLFSAMNLGIVGLIILVATILIGAVLAFGGANFDTSTIVVVVSTVLVVGIMFMIGSVIVAYVSGALC